ncbi:MAG: amidohydrolase [Phycisphaerales bacterium]|nr:MAG: amidohydrolase [Phycisphaerales bacterium]
MDTAALRGLIDELTPSLTEARRTMHRHPELMYKEERTSALVQRALSDAGIEFRAGLAGGTGVVAYLPATRPDARGAIGLRADMDALPIHEATGAPYASETPGVMHACGHDGHTAMLLGAARVLARVEDRPNPVTFVFQPAEEGGAGGKRMCDEGAIDGSLLGPPVRTMFGLHGWPRLQLGVVATRPGPLLAATDNFHITIKGVGGHAAFPHFAHDPIVAGAHCVTALQTIASRAVDPLDSAVVTVGAIHAGDAENVIPGSCVLKGTARTLRAETRALVERRLREIVRHTAGAHGCEGVVEWEPGYPVTDNHPEATSTFFEVASKALGESRVRLHDAPGMGGEDFSFYAQRVPSCFFLLGLLPEGASAMPDLHQAEFDFNDDAIPTGVEAFCRLALHA